ncbi:MAG: dipeptidase [Bacillota bacterium]|nr:dipeptidase [Bacillota bacterium]
MNCSNKFNIIDAHCDTAGFFYQENSDYDFLGCNNQHHIDLPRLKESGIILQFFALYIKDEYKPVGSLAYCLRLLDSYYRTMQRCPDDLQTIYSATDLNNTPNSSKIAALLSVEGGEALEGELAVLRMLFRLGIRSLGLTWNQKNQLATGIGENNPRAGLTTFGNQVIREMNSLGMLIDLAHINLQGFFDVLKISTVPVVVSHANARSICDHPRNLTDEQLRALRDIDGVIGMSCCPDFVDSDHATSDKLLDHFVHVADVAGVDYLGFGADFDGIQEVITGLEDVTGLPRLAKGLSKRGFSRDEIDNITHKNFIRVLQKVLPA